MKIIQPSLQDEQLLMTYKANQAPKSAIEYYRPSLLTQTDIEIKDNLAAWKETTARLHVIA